MTTPLIRIKYGWLVAGVTAQVMHEKYSKGSALGTNDELTAIAAQYNNWWGLHNDQVLEGLIDTLGYEFRQNVIDVYVVPWFTPISDPMIIGPAFKTEEALVNVLSHELAHRLLTDNTSQAHDYDRISEWKSLFGTDLDKRTLVHIPVHAVLKMLYLDVMNRPDILELDISNTKNNKIYADAWNYVGSHEYQKIVASLRGK